MNILYVSKLFGCPWAGPTHSVPAQIAAQSKYDNVLWYNLVSVQESEWPETILEWKKWNYYCDLSDYRPGLIRGLPEPFHKPDLIIMEQFYKFARCKIVREVVSNYSNYIIIPRGELAEEAQKQKVMKKKLFNLIYFNRFARKASAIQYLTNREREDSTERWNRKTLVLPNGTIIPEKFDHKYKGTLKIVSIGRIDIFHKGLDILLEACGILKTKLEQKNVRFHLYGPDENNVLNELQKKIRNDGLVNLISFHGPVKGMEKVKILKEANLFIMTSRFEGHPTGLLEALSYGLPSVVTTGSNMRGEIEACNAGWGADNTAESVCKALDKMLGELDTLFEKSKNAYDLACRYSWDSIAQRSHLEYEKLVGIEKG